MTRFLLIYLGVYGGVHLFLHRRLAMSFSLRGVAAWLLAVFFLLMLVAPVLARYLMRSAAPGSAGPVAWVAYLWMAAAFWLFLVFLGRDAWNLLVRLLSLARPATTALLARGPWSAGVMVGVVAVLMAWGWVEAGRVRVERVTVRTPRLDPGSSPVRLAALSDMHLGIVCLEGRVERTLALVEAEAPDVLVALGDMVDGATFCPDDLASRFRGLSPPMGAYAVTGNHEYYAGLDESLEFLERAGFRVLRGESVMLDSRVRLVGVDDRGREMRNEPPRVPESEALPRGPDREATVLLKHRPELGEGSLGRFDLQLSGHTHGGQLFPFGFLVRRAFPLMGGLRDLGQGSFIYTSRGTGTWGPPLRFLAPPEVTLVTIAPAG